jgi:putative transposase
MPWKEQSAMSERVGLINDYQSGDFGVSELSAEYGISRKTVYKWIERYESGGWEGLKDLSRAPLHHPNATSEEAERAILELKAEKPFWGAPKLHTKLLGVLGDDCPAESTISQILRRHGLSRVGKRRRRAVPSEQPLRHCLVPNAVWSADFKGWFRTGDGHRCTPLTISDGLSRYLLCCQGLREDLGWITLKPLFIATFQQNGMPDAIRTDNGSPFASTGLAGLTLLSVWWIRLGIKLERIEPGKPQQNGRHERMHRTLKEATASPARENLTKQQEAFDAFRREYNEERPHEALGQQPPTSVYQPSSRQYPQRLPEQRGYADGWEKRLVRKGGQIKWHGKDVRVTKALWGQEIGLQPVGDGLWAAYFEDLQLGIFDERKGRIVPLRTMKRLALIKEELKK